MSGCGSINALVALAMVYVSASQRVCRSHTYVAAGTTECKQTHRDYTAYTAALAYFGYTLAHANNSVEILINLPAYAAQLPDEMAH